MHTAIRRKAEELTGRELTWEEETTTTENVSSALLIILKQSSPSPIICYFLFFFFNKRKSIWDRRRHSVQLSALSPAKPQGTLYISTSTTPGNDITSAPGGWRANKNNCYWPRALLQGIFLEPYSAFLRVPCFLVQTYHGLKIPRIFYAVFPLGSHNGAVLLLSSTSVLEREGEKKKAEALNNPNGNRRGRDIIFRSEKWCRRQQSHLRFTFHCPLLNKRPKNFLPCGSKGDSSMFVAKTQLFSGILHGRRRPGGCGISLWQHLWDHPGVNAASKPPHLYAQWHFGCKRHKTMEANTRLCLGCAPAIVLPEERAGVPSGNCPS